MSAQPKLASSQLQSEKESAVQPKRVTFLRRAYILPLEVLAGLACGKDYLIKNFATLTKKEFTLRPIHTPLHLPITLL